ncbi:MAG: 4-(cytidine 5'-diphospho)-2-C-methyl-D-erythritol kinase [Oscillospiraceae bacterium]|nr:4-(cytidine 5'-diphospho)-2-C-methyl-D-erythritol kinase [Oscillospiraceae bacterium]
MRERVTEKAYSKLNLSLDVLRKRPDGYHEMLMVMQSISLCDELSLTISDGDGEISVFTNKSYLPTNEKNLAFVSAKKYLEAAGISDKNIRIDLKKVVPVCAGMGGGSSDAAAVLRALNRHFGGKLSSDELMELGAAIGSDVPFCITGGTMLAYGRGTDFKALHELPDCGFVIIKPQFSIKTPELFAVIDSIKLKARPDTDGLIEAIEKGSIIEVSRRVFDVFEAALPQKYRDTIDKAKLELIDSGALGASMTGTGSAVFGIFESESAAREAVSKLRASFKEVYFAGKIGRIDV